MHDSESGLTFTRGRGDWDSLWRPSQWGLRQLLPAPHLPQPAGYGLETRWQWSRDHANGRHYGSGAVLMRMGDLIAARPCSC